MRRPLHLAELQRRPHLDDSDFAFPEQRKMPLKDAGQVRNALARFAQVTEVSAAERSAAKARIQAAAKRFHVEVADDFSQWTRYAEPLLVAGPSLPVIRQIDLKAGELVRLPYVRVGEWNFRDSYGPVSVTTDDLDTIVRNFQVGARRQDIPLMVNEEHTELPSDADPRTYVGPGAVGWITNLERQGDMVFADVELNRVGEQIYQDDRYRGVSPELLLNWTDPETDQSWGKTAAGLAFSTMPRMKGLAKQGAPGFVAASERARVLAFKESFFPAAEISDSTNTNQVDVGDFKQCPDCDGTGKQNGKQCPTCKGSGQVDSQMNPYPKAKEPAAFADLASVHIDTATNNLSSANASVVTGNKAGDGSPDNVGDVYAYPEQKRLPLNTKAGVTGAMARFMAVDASEQEREVAWTRVMTAGQHYGVEVPQSWRELKAGEVVRWLMQEGDYEAEISEPQICVYQPRPDGSYFGCCPGYTRQPDDDNDGDLDVCMFWKNCNGYIPWNGDPGHAGPMAQLLSTRASSDLPESPATFMKNKETPTMEPTTTETPAAPAAEETKVEPKPEVKASETKVADMAEMRNLLTAAEKRANDQAEALKAAEANIKSLQDAASQRVAADRQIKTMERIDGLVKSGRITPAVKAKMAEEIAKFAESETAEVTLTALELLPENGAVALKELGSGKAPEEGQTPSERLTIASHALMGERKQSTDPKDKSYFENYKAALTEVSGSGQYRA